MGGSASEDALEESSQVFQSRSNFERDPVPKFDSTLKKLPEEILLNNILDFLDWKDVLLLSSVCKYFLYIYRFFSSEVQLSLRKRRGIYSPGGTEPELEYKKYINEKVTELVKKFGNIRSLVFHSRSSLFAIFNNLDSFSRRHQLRKIDLSRLYLFHRPSKKWGIEIDTDENKFHVRIVKGLFNTFSHSLTDVDLKNFQGVTGNVFLKECFEKSKKLRTIRLGYHEPIGEGFNVMTTFTCLQYSKFRPAFRNDIFDPLLKREMKGVTLYDCYIMGESEKKIKNKNEASQKRKQKLMKKFLSKGDALLEFRLYDRYTAELLKKKDFGSLRCFEMLEKMAFFDTLNLIDFSHAHFLVEFEGGLNDSQVDVLAYNTKKTLKKFVFYENKENTDQMIHSLEVCKKLRHIKFLIYLDGKSGDRKVSNYSPELLIEKKVLFPPLFRERLEGREEDVRRGTFGNVDCGKKVVFKDYVGRSNYFYFFWQRERILSPFSRGKNNEVLFD